jgi:threonine dehydratase
MNQDIPVYVVMPNNASALKAHNAAALGAHVIRSGNSWLEREAAVEAIRKQYGLTLVSSSDNTNVILGQGTVGLEMAQQMEAGFSAKLDCLIVPCGGGGLLSGVGIALRNEPTKVFGAEPRDGADDCLRGLISGGRIEAVTTTTIADGLRCPVGKLPWQIIKEPSYVRGIFTASDDHICWTMALVEATMNMVIEPSAAVPLAVVLFNQDFRRYLAQQNRRMHVGVVFSGGNISKTTF